ncbi:MAG: cysteine desulfurase family protein [Alphaproteobacteria bacterium]
MIYLDHMATTPLDPAAIAAMAPWVSGARFGNPHAILNAPGRLAEAAVDEAYAAVAALIGASPAEIVLTSGATESNNLALIGATAPGDHLITVATEHPAVLAVAEDLRERGRTVTVVAVDGHGRVSADAIADAFRPETRLVSVMAVNNETGARQPVDAIARACRDRGILFHTDATQALTTGRIDVGTTPIDLLSLSGHKLYGPQGIGALFVRAGVALKPLFVGGGQQADRRSGTVPVALAAGLGAACRAAIAMRDDEGARLQTLRERLWQGLARAVPGIRRTVPADLSNPACLHVIVPGIDAAEVLLDLPEVAASTGSACASGGKSPVLKAMGLGPRESFGALRLGLGRFTTADEIDRAVALLAGAIGTVRADRPAAE